MFDMFTTKHFWRNLYDALLCLDCIIAPWNSWKANKIQVKNVFREKTTKVNLQTPFKSSQVCLQIWCEKLFQFWKVLKYDKPLSNHLRYVWIQIQYVKGKVIPKQKNKKLTIHQNSTSRKTDQMIVDYGGWFWRGRKTRGLVQHRAVRDTLLCDWDFRHPVTFTF